MKLILTMVVVVMLFGSVGVPVVQAALPTIEEQLRNAREATAAAAAGTWEYECQVRCYPGQDANFTAEMEKHGYDSSLSADVSKFFLSDRDKELSAYYDQLAAATANPSPQGNFCYANGNCINITEDAKKSRELFDKYW